MNKTLFSLLLSGCAFSSGVLEMPSAQAAPVAKPSASPCANPRGVRVTIGSYFDVKDSSDGFSDNEVEVFGNVQFNGQPVWDVARKHAIDATSGRGSLITLSQRTFEVIYNDSSTWNLSVTGYMNDRDRGSHDDTMWNPQKTIRLINIKRLSERYQQRHDSIAILRGDQKSESADLVFRIVKSEDIY